MLNREHEAVNKSVRERKMNLLIMVPIGYKHGSYVTIFKTEINPFKTPRRKPEFPVVPLITDLWFTLFGRMDHFSTFAERASGAVSEVG